MSIEAINNAFYHNGKKIREINREEERHCYDESYCEGKECGECEYHYEDNEELEKEYNKEYKKEV